MIADLEMVILGFFFLSWNSSHAPAVSDLTKPADISITEDPKYDYQYEEVTY